MEYAYVTCLSDDSYIKGVLGLNSTIRQHCKYPLVAVVSRQVLEENVKNLQEAGIKTYICDDYNLIANYKDETFDYWKKTFFKFHIFELEEYDKLVYLDSDMLLTENIDELFEYDDFSAVSDIEFCVNNVNASGINSGMMVFKPNGRITNQLLDIYKRYNEESKKAFGDQEIINYYINTMGIKVNHLSVTYNANYRYLHCYDNNRFKIIHFVLTPKPWALKRTVLWIKVIWHVFHGRWWNAKALRLALKSYRN